MQRHGQTWCEPDGCIFCSPWDRRLWLFGQHGDAYRGALRESDCFVPHHGFLLTADGSWVVSVVEESSPLRRTCESF